MLWSELIHTVAVMLKYIAPGRTACWPNVPLLRVMQSVEIKIAYRAYIRHATDEQQICQIRERGLVSRCLSEEKITVRVKASVSQTLYPAAVGYWD